MLKSDGPDTLKLPLSRSARGSARVQHAQIDAERGASEGGRSKVEREGVRIPDATSAPLTTQYLETGAATPPLWPVRDQAVRTALPDGETGRGVIARESIVPDRSIAECLTASVESPVADENTSHSPAWPSRP